jgi:hypothetical protein
LPVLHIEPIAAAFFVRVAQDQNIRRGVPKCATTFLAICLLSQQRLLLLRLLPHPGVRDEGWPFVAEQKVLLRSHKRLLFA